jgi:hypothetical protein
MSRFRIPKTPQDGLQSDRVDELLRIAAAFESASRRIPGHIQRELVLLARWWGKREIPAVIREAQKVLGRSGR